MQLIERSMRWAVGAAGAALLVAGCTPSTRPDASMPRGEAAYSAIAVPASTQQDSFYRIGPLDTLSVQVFQEKDLSLEKVQVDSAGNVSLPLVGAVPAAGKTAAELEALLAERLTRYLVRPQVSVSVSESASQKVAVQGEVNQAGVYPIKGRTTLLEALALAKGETKLAALNEVVVFRTVNGQRMGAVFDAAAIRRGQAPDPEIQGNDLIVVGYSHAKRIWADVMSGFPILNVFRPF